MRVTAHHANGKVWTDTIVDTEGHASGGEIKPARIGGIVYVSEFTNSGDKYAPPILRYRLHDRRAALAFGSARPRQTQTKIMLVRIDRETCRAEAGAA